MNTMKATTMNGKYTVISCNDGSLDGSGYDYITIARATICPRCGQTWLRTFKYTSGMENADMYPYASAPYEELRYINEHCPNCREAATQNTFFYADKEHVPNDGVYEPKEDRYEVVYDYHDYDFYTDTAYVTRGITERYTDHSDAINRLAELRNDPNAEHIEIIDTDFDF